jgi:hypothetical protein
LLVTDKIEPSRPSFIDLLSRAFVSTPSISQSIALAIGKYLLLISLTFHEVSHSILGVDTTNTMERDHSNDEKGGLEYPNATHDRALLESDYEGKPTPEELTTLRRVAGPMPTVAYLICAVEFAERASYYGVQQLIGNFVNRPLPKGGNGWGAPPRGTQQTAGALGMGTTKANAVSQSFQMLTYVLPVFFGWLADTKTGRFKLICWGVLVFGIAHALMIVSASKTLLENGGAKAPYMLSLYILAVGAGKSTFYTILVIRLHKLTCIASDVQAQRFAYAPRSDDYQSPESGHAQIRRTRH